MRLPLYLAETAIAALLLLAIPVDASVVRDSGAAYDFLGMAGGSVSSDAAACSGSQCGLSELKSAARAIALSAGAKPAPAADRPAMTPDSKNLGGATSQKLGVEPVLFALIAQNSDARSQLCIEDGNLLGMPSTCGGASNPTGPNSTYNCEHNTPRFGMKIECRVGNDTPEPGTLLLLGLGLLALAAARTRGTARKSTAPRL